MAASFVLLGGDMAVGYIFLEVFDKFNLKGHGTLK